ncbi:murein transglycosylase A [Chelatococcus asaccharovorans]|uniref:peptidoglycan lytic exotransglycosylase n=1 Tax=Chelatococcus asaccharovorans TaxID=28210 RepID=A0A2V3U719_9HYPH|nr:MltA domain-containing protein [Chelatococcus asaccharovorans]PXW58865.1 membrane-bound lytic murein transglycosylase A [Chelatococcus asaccharovorans]
MRPGIGIGIHRAGISGRLNAALQGCRISPVAESAPSPHRKAIRPGQSPFTGCGLVLLAAGLALASIASPAFPAAIREVGDARLEPVAFPALDGWKRDDHRAAFRTFLRSCEAIRQSTSDRQPATPTSWSLTGICQHALKNPPRTQPAARRFFERNFAAFRVVPAQGNGFLTGYFEPEYRGSLQPDATFTTPLLGRPDDLVTLEKGERLPEPNAALTAARRTATGLEPYPDRAAIEDGALGAKARPLAYLDPIDAFLAHIQGSVRVRIDDGRVIRLAYAGRNGQPYRSLGRMVAVETGLPPAELNTPKLVAWLKANPEIGRRLMRQNRSYIFFRVADELDPARGPLGGSSVQLVPGRSLAIDSKLWSYGLPFWIEAELPRPDESLEPFRRLMVAQDTGSAILGPARGDIFFGSGPAAGDRAGLIRHPGQFVVLLPRRASVPGGGARP